MAQPPGRAGRLPCHRSVSLEQLQWWALICLSMLQAVPLWMQGGVTLIPPLLNGGKAPAFLPRQSIILRCTHAGRSALQVLILPGNPGSAGYYEAYIAALHAALHGRADIHAVSHLGHASSKKARSHGNKVPLFSAVDICNFAMHIPCQPTMVYALLSDAICLNRPSVFRSRSITRLPMCNST